MLIGVLLGVTWLILLIRYPGRALPISAGALIALGLVVAWVLWQDHRENQRLSRLELRIEYAPQQCTGDRPLRVLLTNHSDRPLQSLRWRIAAHSPGDRLDLTQRSFSEPRYQGPGDLQPGESWSACMPVPPLRPGYRASTLNFRAEGLEGDFAR
ncbi:multidrug transporter [Stutzerimonas tarimensis]|uniref:Multidrug transporter n=1 Tax=Stutzerimonas tarimensis TaxID=1507735 RepID=A0ABV7T4V2_9GAMM